MFTLFQWNSIEQPFLNEKSIHQYFLNDIRFDQPFFEWISWLTTLFLSEIRLSKFYLCNWAIVKHEMFAIKIQSLSKFTKTVSFYLKNAFMIFCIWKYDQKFSIQNLLKHLELRLNWNICFRKQIKTTLDKVFKVTSIIWVIYHLGDNHNIKPTKISHSIIHNKFWWIFWYKFWSFLIRSLINFAEMLMKFLISTFDQFWLNMW